MGCTNLVSRHDTAAPVGDFRMEALGPDLDEEWDRVAVQAAAPPFLRPGWIRASTAAFPPQGALRAATVRRGGRLVALFPLVSRRGVLRTLKDTETPETGLVAVDDESAHALVDHLTREPARRADLRRLVVHSPTASALRQVESAQSRPFVWETIGVQPVVDLDGDWVEYRSRHLSSRRRSRLRNLERRLAEEGAVTFQVISPTDDLDQLFSEGFQMELRGWKGRAGTAVLSRDGTRDFYQRLTGWTRDLGILRMAFLRLDGRAIAFALNLEQGGTSYGLKLGFDEAFASLSPGVQLLHRLVEHGFADPSLSRLRMLGAADTYKMGFATSLDEQVRVRAFGPGPLGRIERAAVLAERSTRAAVRARLPEPVARRLVVVRDGVHRIRRPR
jgi:CelD/BcsL family acetyltransferase involved in cellulose biosynthesis